MKRPTNILIPIFFLLTLIGCVEADPLRPDGPVLEVDTTDLVFNALFKFQSETKEIAIENTGDADLIINEIVINDNVSGVFTTSKVDNLILVPGARDTILVNFQPKDFIRYDTDLFIKSNFKNDKFVNLEGAGIPKKTLQKDWEFRSQSEIDLFAAEFYDEVPDEVDDILISSVINAGNDPILNLSALSIFKKVKRLEVTNNRELEDLKGLENINVTNRLTVASNEKIESLNQLTGLVSSKFNIELANNTNLQSLDFLRPLNLIGDLKVTNNRLIRNFLGAENIRTIDGDLVIQDNRFLTSLNGLEGVNLSIAKETANGNMVNRIIDDISIRNNGQLVDLCGISGIINNPDSDSAYGTIVIAGNASNDITVESIKMGSCK